MPLKYLPWVAASIHLVVVLVLDLVLMPNGLGSSGRNYYELYAMSLKNGTLAVAAGPTQFACLADMSYYDGKCYLYWGIFPAFIHAFFPWLHDRTVTLIAGTVAVFFLIRLFLRLTLSLTGGREPRSQSLWPTLLFLVLGTGIATTSICGWVYGEAILVSLALGFAAIDHLVKIMMATPNQPPRTVDYFWVGLGLAFAALSRPTWFLVFLPAVALTAYSLLKHSNGVRRVEKFALLVLPLVLAAIFQTVLNYVRFDSPFDFGMAYLVAGAPRFTRLPRVAPPFTLESAVWNSIAYFISVLPPFSISGDLPNWTDLTWFTRYTLDHLTHAEFGLGLLAAMPSLILVFPRVYRERRQLKWSLVAFALLLPLSLVVWSTTGNSFRYIAEAWVAMLALLIPVLWAASDRLPVWEKGVHWASFVFCLGISILNTYWVVVTRLRDL